MLWNEREIAASAFRWPSDRQILPFVRATKVANSASALGQHGSALGLHLRGTAWYLRRTYVALRAALGASIMPTRFEPSWHDLRALDLADYPWRYLHLLGKSVEFVRLFLLIPSYSFLYWRSWMESGII